MNEETKKLHRSGNVVISSSSSTSSKSTAEAKVGLLDAATDDDDNNKEFKEILEEVEEQKDALEEKNTAAGKTKVASCKGKSPNFEVQASVAISGAGITSASQISTHPEFADSFSKTIVTLTGADEDQLMWLDLSTRPLEEEEGEKRQQELEIRRLVQFRSAWTFRFRRQQRRTGRSDLFASLVLEKAPKISPTSCTASLRKRCSPRRRSTARRSMTFNSFLRRRFYQSIKTLSNHTAGRRLKVNRLP